MTLPRPPLNPPHLSSQCAQSPFPRSHSKMLTSESALLNCLLSHQVPSPPWFSANCLFYFIEKIKAISNKYLNLQPLPQELSRCLGLSFCSFLPQKKWWLFRSLRLNPPLALNITFYPMFRGLAQSITSSLPFLYLQILPCYSFLAGKSLLV